MECKYHCRCMNLDKSCPNPHYLDDKCICERPNKAKEIIVLICEDEKFFADITKKYVNDIDGEYKGAITLMARFPESERPKIAEFLMNKK